MKILGNLDGNFYGGKINNLDFLIKNGFNVPRSFILQNILQEKELNYIYSNYLGANIYIVRSSASCEDSNKISYAGLFISKYGFYKNGNLYKDTLEVFESINNKYIDLYEEQIIGKVDNNRKMNVLVQEYIVGDFSGVYFSNLDNKRVLGIISGGNSLLVDGKVNGTNIYMGEDFSILKIEYNLQYKILNSNLDIVDFYKKTYIDKKLLLKLIKQFIKIEKLYQIGVDVEWVIKDEEIYILQVRPITK